MGILVRKSKLRSKSTLTFLILAAVVALSGAITACATDEVSLLGVSGGTETTSTTTISVEPVGIVATGEPVDMHAVDWAYFVTLEEMFAAAELVIHGEVVDAQLDRVLSGGAPAGEDSFLQEVLFTVKSIETLKGPTDATFTIARSPYVRSGDLLRPVLWEGLSPAEIGDEVLWFLVPFEKTAGASLVLMGS